MLFRSTQPASSGGPPVWSIVVSGPNQVTITVGGGAGQKHTLQSSSNLVDWGNISAGIMSHASMDITSAIPQPVKVVFFRVLTER